MDDILKITMSSIQYSLNLFTPQALRDAGMAIAAESAEHKEPGWNDKAFELLKDFIKGRTSDFLCEDFRSYCEAHDLTAPPSLRAYGGIIMRASKRGLIRKVGHAQVKNPKAHMANAARWTKNLMQD